MPERLQDRDLEPSRERDRRRGLLERMVISGQSGGLTRDLLMTLSWAIDVAVAEAIVSRRKRASHARMAQGRGGTVAGTPR